MNLEDKRLGKAYHKSEEVSTTRLQRRTQDKPTSNKEDAVQSQAHKDVI